jgi:hypothetical protein
MRKAALTTLLAVLAVPASAAFDPNRTVTAVDYAAKTFNCQAKPGYPAYLYRTTGETVFRISGRRVRLSYIWNNGSLSELKVGERVTVEYHLKGDERIADRVVIHPAR